MMRKAKRDILIGGAAITIAVLGWFLVIPSGVDVPSSVKILALSPDFWPRIIMGMMAICGGIVLAQGIVAPRADTGGLFTEAGEDITPDEPEETVHFDTHSQFIRIFAAFTGLFAFYLLVPYLGVVTGAMILVLASTRILGVQSWLKCSLMAVTLPVLLYFFFTKIAHIPVPLGLLEELR